MVLDRTMLEKVAGYYVTGARRPRATGRWQMGSNVQRQALWQPTSGELRATIDWD